MENVLEGLLHLEHLEPLLTLLLAYVSYVLTGIYKTQKELEKKFQQYEKEIQKAHASLSEDIAEINTWKEFYIKASDSFVKEQKREFDSVWRRIAELARSSTQKF